LWYYKESQYPGKYHHRQYNQKAALIWPLLTTVFWFAKIIIVSVGFYMSRLCPRSGGALIKTMPRIYKQNCDHCNKHYESPNGKYCSRSCYIKAVQGFCPSPETQFKSGTKHPRWKGGIRRSKKYYVRILQPDHPRACDRYVKRCILVAEKCLERPLDEKEIVHHLGARTDDRPEMLYVFPDKLSHDNYHKAKNKPALKSNLL
jgi:hypothetical protein